MIFRVEIFRVDEFERLSFRVLEWTNLGIFMVCGVRGR